MIVLAIPAVASSVSASVTKFIEKGWVQSAKQIKKSLLLGWDEWNYCCMLLTTYYLVSHSSIYYGKKCTTKPSKGIGSGASTTVTSTYIQWENQKVFYLIVKLLTCGPLLSWCAHFGTLENLHTVQCMYQYAYLIVLST